MDGSSDGVRGEVRALTERPSAEVLIVGGGINGIAIFRDLALQGVDVALVERSDYISGASAASSHMIHGGIRYLENGEFRLVKESVTERNGLLQVAPHYVKPLKTTIPIFSLFSGIISAPARFLLHRSGKPTERGAVLIKSGLVMYDGFSRRGTPRHAFHGRRRSLAELPELDPGVKFTATYFDASVHDPERLAIDVLRDGLVAGGERARAANYVELTGAADGAVLLRDRESGQEFPFHARVVLNVTGPWADIANTAIGNPTRYMGGTRGSHIVLDNPGLLAACAGRELFFENGDGRIVLIYPMKGRVLVGTTDLEADPGERAVCTDEEIEYFFGLISRVFPRVAVDRSQIVYTFSGIRPLPRHDDLQPGFVSRDYRVVRDTVAGLDGTPVLTVVGGKWTTFRALSEHLGDEVLDVLGRHRTVSTAELPIGGGREFPADAATRQLWISAHADGISTARTAQLLDRYGTRAEELLGEIAEQGESPLSALPDYSDFELAHVARTEQVVHLSDLALRRSALAFTGALSADALVALAEAVGEALGWDAERRGAEEKALAAELVDAHRVTAGPHGTRLAADMTATALSA